MAWIAVVPPSPRHPYERYQVRYQEGKRQRSAGIFPTKRRAEAERRAIERGRTELARATDIDLEHLGDRLFEAFVGVGDDQLHPGQAAAHQRAQQLRQNASVSTAPTSRPITSRWPQASTP